MERKRDPLLQRTLGPRQCAGTYDNFSRNQNMNMDLTTKAKIIRQVQTKRYAVAKNPNRANNTVNVNPSPLTVHVPDEHYYQPHLVTHCVS